MKKKLFERALSHVNRWNEPIDVVQNEKTISVIIPVYHPQHLDAVLNHLSKFSEVDEIILVDDSGDFDIYNYQNIIFKENIYLYYHQKNLGRSATRNTGAAVASGDILVFLDQDMFLNPCFILNAQRYFQANESIIYLGLRDTVPFSDIPSYERWISPSSYKDWRIRTSVSEEFVDLTLSTCGSVENNCIKGDCLEIYKQTNCLKNLGIKPDNTIGFWDLPSMVISHSMAISKSDFLCIGGFPEWISGWGGEDIVTGFLACAKHIPIYLSDDVSYQAAHKPYSGSEEAKLKELRNNIRYYKEWAKAIEEFPFFDLEKIKSRGKKLRRTNV